MARPLTRPRRVVSTLLLTQQKSAVNMVDSITWEHGRIAARERLESRMKRQRAGRTPSSLHYTTSHIISHASHLRAARKFLKLIQYTNPHHGVSVKHCPHTFMTPAKPTTAHMRTEGGSVASDGNAT